MLTIEEKYNILEQQYEELEVMFRVKEYDEIEYKKKIGALEEELAHKENVLCKYQATESELLHSIGQLEEELWEFVAENNRLVEIHREMNNATRGIMPKKEHLGYFFKKYFESCTTFWIKVGYEQYNFKGNCWEYVMETPYTVLIMPMKKSLMLHIIKNDELFEKLDLMYISDAEKEKMMMDIYKGVAVDNFVFDVRCELNANNGYWNIVFKTLYQIETGVSEEYFKFKK